ncbi:MAG: hypothetical protein HQ515_10730 [Phycisphaeraceae bacterium]|nr:hypothetical protein [Phycisphaeraceae bacterium]
MNSPGIDVVLPGGLARNGCIERRARFHALTGRMEQSLIELERGLDRPLYVTAVLGATLKSIGKQPADVACVADLCVADRQYLMLRLAAMLNGEQMWLKVTCAHCASPFDVEVRRCDLPVKEAGQEFPTVTLQTEAWEVDIRVPTGADQANIGDQSEEEAMHQLLQDCILSVNGSPPEKGFINSLSATDIEAIDEALDEASPAVCNQLRVTCPECAREQYADLDHYVPAEMNRHTFYDEVHTLASHYHWSESAILDLPQARRRLYLDLINRSAGMTGQG